MIKPLDEELILKSLAKKNASLLLKSNNISLEKAFQEYWH
jgi:hypothetical protein